MLGKNGEWLGPPAVYTLINGQRIMIDGRQRFAETKARRLSTAVWVTVDSHFEAVRHLILNGHPDRAVAYAREHAPVLLHRSVSDAAALVRLPRQKMATFTRALLSPAERHKLPRRAMHVVHRLRTVLKKAEEGQPITLWDLQRALGEFVND